MVYLFPLSNLDNPVHLCDFAAALTSGDPEELQAILEELNVKVGPAAWNEMAAYVHAAFE